MPVSNPVKEPGVNVVSIGDGRYLVESGTSTQNAWAVVSGGETWVFVDGQVFVVAPAQARHARTAATDDDGALAAPMPATVARIEVSEGQTVTRDSLLVMLEAMKMELPIRAPRDGRVTAIHCRVGEIVQPGVPLLDLS